MHNSQFIRSLSCISSYKFWLIYRAILGLVSRVVCMLMIWKLRDLILQIVVKIFVVILYKIYYKDEIQIDILHIEY